MECIVATGFLGVLSAPLLIFFCLKIKSNKKNRELLGTVGTVKVIQDGDAVDHRDAALHRVDGIETLSESHPLGGTRTPSRSGERKLPDIPISIDETSVASDLYATIGLNGTPPGTLQVVNDADVEADNDNSEDSDVEVEEGEKGEVATGVALEGDDGPLPGSPLEKSKIHHPYAKVKKRPKDHPYATVRKPVVAEATSQLPPQEDVNYNPRGVSPIHTSFEETATTSGESSAQRQQQHFSGDSQDSSKGYTSISVREPLRHIQHTLPPGAANGIRAESATTTLGAAPGIRNVAKMDATYMAVSETSDDMYAAIEDPGYIPAASQSNSETYAVIHHPDEEDVEAAPDEDEDDHPYSRIDRSKKRCIPVTTSQSPHQRSSLSVEAMYAKVNKGPHRDPGSVGARPRIRSAPCPPPVPQPRTSPYISGDLENSEGQSSSQVPTPSVKAVRTARSAPAAPKQDPVSTCPEQTTTYDADYENVSDLHTTTSSSADVSSFPYRPTEDGYELVVGRTNDVEGGGDLGYETVPNPSSTDSNVPYRRMFASSRSEPPYAKLINKEDTDDEEEEEGYETIPPNKSPQESKDLDYEIVSSGGSGDGSRSVISYETVSAPSVSNLLSSSTDPCYETLPVYAEPIDSVLNLPTPNAQNNHFIKRKSSQPSASHEPSLSTESTTNSRNCPTPFNHHHQAPRRKSSSSSVVVIEHFSSVSNVTTTMNSLTSVPSQDTETASVSSVIGGPSEQNDAHVQARIIV